MGQPRSLRSDVVEMSSRLSTLTGMVLVLGAIALLLAAVGVYGVVAFAASQRSQELAIRVALGARRADVVRGVLAPGIRPILAGIVVGVVVALGGSAALAVALQGAPAALNPFD